MIFQLLAFIGLAVVDTEGLSMCLNTESQSQDTTLLHQDIESIPL